MPISLRSRRPARLGALSLLLALASVPASAQDSKSLGRKIPAKDLSVYVEFDGFDAHAKEWKASAMYKALNQTTLGILIEDLAKQGIDAIPKAKETNVKGGKVVELIEKVFKAGFALGIGKIEGGPQPPPACLVVRGPVGLELAALMQAAEKSEKKTTKVGGRTVTKYNEDSPTGSVYIEDGGDFVFASPASLEGVLATLDGKAPNATTHPIAAELGKADGPFTPLMKGFVDIAALPAMPPQAAMLGLDGLKRVDYRWGFRDDATYSVLRVMAPSPRRGLLGLFDGPTFDKSTLPAVPAGLESFTAASLSLGQLYDKILAIAKQMTPGGDQQVTAMTQQVDQMLGVKLRDEFLAKLGPKWTVYIRPAAVAGGLPVDAIVTTEVADSTKFRATLDKVMNFANAMIQARAGGMPQPGQPQPNGAGGPAPQFRKIAGEQAGYELFFPPGSVPPQMGLVKPTILVGKKSLAISTTAGGATAALAVAEGTAPRWTPDAALAKALDTLPKGIVFLSVSDPRQTLPQAIAGLPNALLMLNMGIAGANQGKPGGGNPLPFQVDASKIPQPSALSQYLLPSTSAISVDARGISITTRESLPSVSSPAVAGVAVALLLPAVQAAREAARRAQCVNNEKQMGLALHNYHSTYNMFPGNILGKDGKPLLSWRVAILPYIEANNLYERFKLDEPWDSPNNKPLMAEMPVVFACPSRGPEPGMTHYQGWSGPGTFFGKKDLSIAEITDGTSTTIAVFEAAKGVPWTKPEDVPFDPESNVPLLGAGSTHPGGFNALFADGSVRFIKTTINALTLKALATVSGGEVVTADSF